MRKITIKECEKLREVFIKYTETAETDYKPLLNILRENMDATIAHLTEENIYTEDKQKEVNDMFDVISVIIGLEKPDEEPVIKQPSKFKKILKQIGYWTWCLPQTLVGLIVSKVNKGLKHIYVDPETGLEIEYYMSEKFKGGISLGKYIIVNECMDDEHTIKHEYGHQLQSFILGPLYLLVIGLPSLIWSNCFNKYRSEKKLSYYDFYTEKWANKLAGLK